MIRIIKEVTRKIAKCSNCGCKFSYEEEDINMFPNARRNSVTLYINCPQCNKAVGIMVERRQHLIDKDKIFVIGFDKSGETSDGSPSDFIDRYEKVPGNNKFLRLVSRYPVTKSDKTCQI